jgi:hypothetical protein
LVGGGNPSGCALELMFFLFSGADFGARKLLSTVEINLSLEV